MEDPNPPSRGPKAPPESSHLETLWRQLAAAERLRALDEPGEALARAQGALGMARQLCGDEVRMFKQLLHSRMTTHRGTIAMREAAGRALPARSRAGGLSG